MTPSKRLDRLEEVAGHCPACANADPVVRVEYTGADPAHVAALRRMANPEPEAGAGVCPQCGHDRTVVVNIVLVRQALPTHLEAPCGD